MHVRAKILLYSIFFVVTAVASLLYWYNVVLANIGTIQVYAGSAQILRKDKPEAGLTGSPVRLRDTLVIGSGSRVSLVLKDGSIVRLEEGTRVEIAKLVYKNVSLSEAVFRLRIGKLWLHVKPLTPKADVEVETPTVVAAVRGTVFDVMRLEQKSSIRVYERMVAVHLKSNPAETKEVVSGQNFTLRDDHLQEDFSVGPIAVLPDDVDDWTRFNLAEDAKLGETNAPAVSPDFSLVTASPENPPRITASVFSATPMVTLVAKPTPWPASSMPKTSGTPVLSPTPTPAPILQYPKFSLTAVPYALTVTIGESAQVQALAKYPDGSIRDEVGRVTWVQAPLVGTLDTQGIFTGTALGSSWVHAQFDGNSSNEIFVTVRQKPKELASIAVTYQWNPTAYATSNPAMPSAQFTAIAQYIDGSSLNVTNQAAWRVAVGTAKGQITAQGLYTPATYGTDTVVAATESKVGSQIITTQQAHLQ